MTEKKLNLHQKLIEIRKSISFFVKDKKSFNFNYVSGSQVLAEIKGKMDELGILLVPSLEHNPDFMIHEYDTIDKYWKPKHNIDFVVNQKMKYTWIDSDNPKDREVVDWSLYGDQDDPSKALGSGLTYSERYFLMKFFDIPTDELDPDTKEPKTIANIMNKKQEEVKKEEPKKEEPKKQTTNTVDQVIKDIDAGVDAWPVVDDPVEDEKDADAVRFTEWQQFVMDATFALTEAKARDEITVDDIKNIGLDLQNKWRCDNKDKVYIKIRDQYLKPLIDDLSNKK